MSPRGKSLGQGGPAGWGPEADLPRRRERDWVFTARSAPRSAARRDWRGWRDWRGHRSPPSCSCGVGGLEAAGWLWPAAARDARRRHQIERLIRSRRGFLFRRGGETVNGGTVGDEVLHGHDHGEGLDLAGNAASGHLGAEIGDFPEAGQYLFAVQVQPALSFHGTPGQVSLLLDELLLHGGAVLEHEGADTGLGFGVGGGVGVEADGFSGLTVGHGASEDQAGKGYFLIGDGVVHFIFGHRWLREFERSKGQGFLTRLEARWVHKKSRGGGVVGIRPYLWQGSGGTPDSGKAVLRSRLRPKLPATTRQRAVTRESACCRNHLPTVYSATESDLAARLFPEPPVIVS